MTPDQEKLLDDLLEVESGLTAWEMDFLDGLDQTKRPEGCTLTEKQTDVLERIAERVL